MVVAKPWASRRASRGDEAAINNLIDARNECDLFEETVGFLGAAFG